jgi:tryptophan halogenase
LFASGGRFVGDVDPVFDKGDWANAFSSVGILPATYDPLLEAMPQAELDDHFARMRQAMEQAIGGMPTHADLLSHLGATA